LLSSFLGSYSRSQLGQASSPCETEGRQRKREAKVAAHTGVEGEGGGEGEDQNKTSAKHPKVLTFLIIVLKFLLLIYVTNTLKI
jgi:hypothetical protein